MTRPGFPESMTEKVNRDLFLLMCINRNEEIVRNQM